MSEKKILNLFKDGKPHTKKYQTKQDSFSEKQEIEQLQKLISDKLRDPELAKKAAQIIESMIAEQTKKKLNKKGLNRPFTFLTLGRLFTFL